MASPAAPETRLIAWPSSMPPRSNTQFYGRERQCHHKVIANLNAHRPSTRRVAAITASIAALGAILARYPGFHVRNGRKRRRRGGPFDHNKFKVRDYLEPSRLMARIPRIIGTGRAAGADVGPPTGRRGRRNSRSDIASMTSSMTSPERTVRRKPNPSTIALWLFAG